MNYFNENASANLTIISRHPSTQAYVKEPVCECTAKVPGHDTFPWHVG